MPCSAALLGELLTVFGAHEVHGFLPALII